MEDEGDAAGERVSFAPPTPLPDTVGVLETQEVVLRLPCQVPLAEALEQAVCVEPCEKLPDAVLQAVPLGDTEVVVDGEELTEAEGEALGTLGLAPPEGVVEEVEEEEGEAAAEAQLLGLCAELTLAPAEALEEALGVEEVVPCKLGLAAGEGLAEAVPHALPVPLRPLALRVCVEDAVGLAEGQASVVPLALPVGQGEARWGGGVGVPCAEALLRGEGEAPPVAVRHREGEAEALGEPEGPTPLALRWALLLGLPLARGVTLAQSVALGEALPWALEKVGRAVAVLTPPPPLVSVGDTVEQREADTLPLLPLLALEKSVGEGDWEGERESEG